MKNCGVLIVGAGPAGLLMALELKRAGISFRIIDGEIQRPDTESRAIGLHPRSLEAYARNGVVQPFIDEGMTLSAANFYSNGERILRIDLEGNQSQPYPFSMLVQQGKSERFLIERLRTLGVEVERPVRLEAIAQSHEAATAVLRHPDGALETIQSDYIVGCDGAHSVVRQSLGIEFPGHPLEGRFATGDVHIDFPESSEWPEHEIHTLLRPGIFAIIGKLKDGTWRVVVDVTDKKEINADNVTVKDLQDGFGFFEEFKGQLRDPQWISVFRVSSRVATTMRRGRFFLAGDAAHIHSPESGQGMNAGVQDVVNLSWKLATVLRGVASPSLLDSYEAERLPIVRTIVRETEIAQRAINLESPVWIALRDMAADKMGRLLPIQRVLTSAFSATAYDYANSTLVGQYGQPPAAYLKAVLEGLAHPSIPQHLTYRSGPAPGDWAPDVAGLVLPDGTEVRLHQLMANDLRSVVLVIAGSSPNDSDMTRLRQLTSRLASDFGVLLDPHLIVLKRSSDAVHDRNGELHACYGAAYDCVYLIRPDGFIGFRSQPAEAGPLLAHFSKNWALGEHATMPYPIQHGPVN